MTGEEFLSFLFLKYLSIRNTLVRLGKASAGSELLDLTFRSSTQTMILCLLTIGIMIIPKFVLCLAQSLTLKFGINVFN